MPSPFPGMDPYLEAADLWPDVHHELIGEIRAQLNPRLPAGYVARVEQYTFLFDPDDPGSDLYVVPDVRLMTDGRSTGGGGGTATQITPGVDVTGRTRRVARQRYLEVREVGGRGVVTCIEVLSPANKRPNAEGRRRFIQRRKDVTASAASWVEIDLLRGGRAATDLPIRPRPSYYALVDRPDAATDDGRRQVAWPVGLRERLPTIGVPLREPEADVPLDLQAALDAAYERGGYGRDRDYAAAPPPPKLSAADLAWCKATATAAL